MARHRIGDAVTTALGDAAGAVIDPREGLQRARASLSAPALAGGAVALVAGAAVALVTGFLLGRRSRR
jgi:hypothetical protein